MSKLNGYHPLRLLEYYFACMDSFNYEEVSGFEHFWQESDQISKPFSQGDERNHL